MVQLTTYTQLEIMKTGVQVLQRLYRLLEENPEQFEVEFNFNGRAPISTDEHVSETRIIGAASVYPLFNGERIWGTKSTNRSAVAYVDLGTGNIRYTEDPFWGGQAYQRRHSGYGTGLWGRNEIEYSQLKSLWQDALQKVKGTLENSVAV